MRDGSKYKERRIKKLDKEYSEVEKYEYAYVEAYGHDVDARLYAAQQKKKLLVRSLVIENHLAIEDFIDSLLETALLRRHPNLRRKKNALQAHRYFIALFKEAGDLISGNYSIGFKKKIILLRTMGVIGKKMYEDLDALNSRKRPSIPTL